MTNVELIAELKLLGFGAGLTDPQWTQAAKDAVRMYSRQRPRHILGTIATEADVEEYSLPAGGYLCIELAPIDVLEDLSELISDASTLAGALAGGDVIIDLNQPSQVDIYRQKLEHWARQFGTKWDQDMPGGKVRVMPRPESVTTLAVLYTAWHATADTVPTEDADLLILAGKAVATAVMATGGAASVVASGGRLTLGPYTKDMGGIGAITIALFKQAEAQERAFLDAARLPAAAYKA